MSAKGWEESGGVELQVVTWLELCPDRYWRVGEDPDGATHKSSKLSRSGS